jgi:hypothetical protein
MSYAADIFEMDTIPGKSLNFITGKSWITDGFNHMKGRV